MTIQEFIPAFAEAIEIEDATSLTPNTNFRDLEEWSSLSVMVLVAFYDENFGKEVNNITIKKCSTIQDLYDLTK